MTRTSPDAVGRSVRTENGITIDPHAQERWSERTPAEESLLAAWQTAQPVQAPERTAQEVRLHLDYDVLLVFSRGLLKTAMDYDEAVYSPQLAQCEHCGRHNDVVTTESCRYCTAEESLATGDSAVSLSRGGN